MDRRDFLALASAAVLGGVASPAWAQTTDLADLSMAEAIARVRRRAVSPGRSRASVPVAHRRSTTGRCTPSSPSRADKALADARTMEAEARRGQWRGPLHGIPIALKDNIDTAGVRTTGASRLFEQRVPTADAEVARRLEAGWRDPARQAQPPRVRLRRQFHGDGVRDHAEPVAPRPRHRRVVRRPGRRGRRGPVLRVARHRHRRLDPHARVALRHRRA